MESVNRAAVARRWVLGHAWQGINKQITDFQVNENTLYDTAIMDTHHYTFVQVHEHVILYQK